MASVSTGPPPAWRAYAWMAGCWVAGVAMVLASAAAEHYWAWEGVTIGIAGNVGTGLALAGVLFLLERRFDGAVRRVGGEIKAATAALEARQGDLAESLDSLRAATEARIEDRRSTVRRAVRALGAQVSARTVTDAMASATDLGAIDGILTVRGGELQAARVSFSWGHRPDQPDCLEVGLHLRSRDPRMPVVVEWVVWEDQSPAEVGRRLYDIALRTKQGPVDFDWQMAVSELRGGLALAGAFVDGPSSGAVVEVGPGRWFITTSGVEHLDHGHVIDRRQVPAGYLRQGTSASPAWPPTRPAWADATEWNAVLAAANEHLPTSWVRPANGWRPACHDRAGS